MRDASEFDREEAASRRRFKWPVRTFRPIANCEIGVLEHFFRPFNHHMCVFLIIKYLRDYVLRHEAKVIAASTSSERVVFRDVGFH